MLRNSGENVDSSEALQGGNGRQENTFPACEFQKQDPSVCNHPQTVYLSSTCSVPTEGLKEVSAHHPQHEHINESHFSSSYSSA